MENAGQTRGIGLRKVVAITGLLRDSEVLAVLHEYTNKYLGSLVASVLCGGNEDQQLKSVSDTFGLVIRQKMSPKQFDSVLIYRIVRDLVAAFAIAFPQHVHHLIGGELVDSVNRNSQSDVYNLLKVPVYMQGAIVGAVKGLNKFREISDDNVFGLFESVGKQVGATFAQTHHSYNIFGQILTQAESELGREVVEIAQMRGNPFGSAFLTAFWKALSDSDRSGLSVQNGCAISRAFIRAFAIRHVATLPTRVLMNMIVPASSDVPS